VKLVIGKGPRKGQVALSKRDDDNREVASACGPFLSAKHFREAAGDLGVEVKVFRDAVVAVRDGESESEEIDLTPPASAFEVSVRGIRERGDGAITFTHADPVEALRLALAYVGHPAGEPVISWGDLDRLAAVDVDYHRQAYADRPSETQAYARMSAAIPRSVAVWQTHGRGLRLIYGARAGYTAGELAAVAALAIATHDPSARVELKHETRHPGYPRGGQVCGPVRIQTPDADVDGIRAWLRTRRADDDAVANWLTSRGFEVGRRYPHSRCPVRPDEGGDRDPVHVRDDGILCYACRGRGVTHGSRSPGWFTFHSLAGAVIDSTVATCIDSLTHWGHARFVIEEATRLEGDVARLAYRAALRVVHGEDRRELIDAVFTVEPRTIRQRGFWSTPSGEVIAGEIRGMLATLPAATIYPGGLGAGVARFAQPIDLSREGYPALAPVWGTRVYGEYLTPRNPNTTPIVVQTPDLDPDYAAPFRPRYRLKANRMPIDDAWDVVEETCPGVNREYLQLLIASRGCQEGEVGLPPMVFVSGPSGGGKTGTAHLAAAMLGDRITEGSWNPSIDRFRQQLQSAKERGSFCVFNEYLKGAASTNTDAVKAMDLALNFTYDSASHKMYVGSVTLGTPPVILWTDTTLPDAIRQSAQLARRIVGVHLEHALDWKDRLAAAGIQRIALLRIHDPRWCDAADAIVSDVIDRYFTWPTDFQVIARTLGFRTLAESDAAEEGREQLRAFFRAICQSPTISPASAVASRFKGRGWVDLPRFGESDLALMWRAIADEEGVSSRRCTEVDWCRVLGVEGPPIKVEFKSYGRALVCRFIQATNRTIYRVNGEIVGESPNGPPSEDWKAIDWSILEGVEV